MGSHIRDVQVERSISCCAPLQPVARKHVRSGSRAFARQGLRDGPVCVHLVDDNTATALADSIFAADGRTAGADENLANSSIVEPSYIPVSDGESCCTSVLAKAKTGHAKLSLREMAQIHPKPANLKPFALSWQRSCFALYHGPLYPSLVPIRA